MIKAPIISVVFPTYNRCNTVKVTLERLSLQLMSAGDYEVIVVDDGSTDETPKVIQSLMVSVPYRLRYLRNENRGPGYSQNRGIREAHSDVILIIADDIWPTPKLLAQHVKSHSEHPGENIAVLGRVLQSPELPPTVIHKHWDPFRFGRLEDKKELESVYFFGCNISVKRGFLTKNGMFKERKGTVHEDVELGYRLGQKGLRILYNKDALAYHYHKTTLADACRQAYNRGLNFDMLSKHIPKELIFPLYHICALEAGLKVFIRMLPREIPRKLLFNRWSVECFWIPLLEWAERSRITELFANPLTYRGVVGYYQRKGYKDMKREERKAMRAKRSVPEACKEMEKCT